MTRRPVRQGFEGRGASQHGTISNGSDRPVVRKCLPDELHDERLLRYNLSASTRND